MNRRRDMSFFQLSNWLVGIANGYTPSGSISAETVAGTIAVSSVLAILGDMDKVSKEMIASPVRTSISASLGPSLFFGSIFFIGHQVGTALRCALKEQSERRDD